MTTYTITEADLTTCLNQRLPDVAHTLLSSLTPNSGEAVAPSTSNELVEMAAAEQKPIGRFTGKFTVDAHDRMLCEIVCNGAIPTAGAALYDTPPKRHPEQTPGAAPSTKPANGWIAVKDQMPPPQVRVLGFEPQHGLIEVDMWFGPDFTWGYSYWTPLPTPPIKGGA